MITLENDRLDFHFPEVHREAHCSINFQRTLRLPDDGETYPLPAGLGRFPLRHTDDFASLPDAIRKRGGVIMPMWQAEALWISFSFSFGHYPFAVKIGAGKINAVTGDPWSNELHRDPQDYVVLPEQFWLDGFCVDHGVIRQFVAAPLGCGMTAEEQLTQQAEHGGLQIVVYPMKKKFFERSVGPMLRECYEMLLPGAAAPPMGLAAGGLMRQQICEDPHDFEVWDQSVSARCFVTILNAASWHAMTGEEMPTKPITPETYQARGIPWFDYYDADQKELPGSKALAGLKTVRNYLQFGLPQALWKEKQAAPYPLVKLTRKTEPRQATSQVREGDF